MKNCEKEYGIIKQINYKKEIQKIEEFCKLLRGNKVKDSKAKFLELSPATQCMFLDVGWKILSSPKNLEELAPSVYRYSFFLYKLFRGKEAKEIKTYDKYRENNKELNMYYKRALDWNKELTASRSGKETKKKSSEKEFQKYEIDKLDPLYFYYTSLYKENKNSRISINWLTEHGIFEGTERDKLVEKYQKNNSKSKIK